IGEGNVTASSVPGNPAMFVTLRKPLNGANPPLLTGDGSGLTGGTSPTVTITSVGHVDVNSSASPGYSSLVSADFDGDGRLDMVVTDFFDNQVVSFSGYGTAFLEQGPFLPDAGFFSDRTFLKVGVGDFNGDGRPDLANPNGEGGGASVRLDLGNGDGTFQ